MTQTITHEVLFDGEHFMYANSITAARDYARGARRPLRARGERYVGRFTIRPVKSKAAASDRQPPLSSFIDPDDFLLVGSVKQGGEILSETFFHAGRTNVKIEIDYTYTEKGFK